MDKQIRIEFGDTDPELAGQWAVIKNPRAMSWKTSKELVTVSKGNDEDKFAKTEQLIAKYVVAWHVLDAENDTPLDTILPSSDLTVLGRTYQTIVLAIVIEIKNNTGVQNPKNSMTDSKTSSSGE
jgi:hypothetical protein